MIIDFQIKLVAFQVHWCWNVGIELVAPLKKSPNAETTQVEPSSIEVTVVPLKSKELVPNDPGVLRAWEFYQAHPPLCKRPEFHYENPSGEIFSV